MPGSRVVGRRAALHSPHPSKQSNRPQEAVSQNTIPRGMYRGHRYRQNFQIRPFIQCLAIFQIVAGQPLVVIRAVPTLAYEILLSATALPLVNDTVNEMFDHPVFSHDGAGL